MAATKSKLRYSGIDNRPWKVTDRQGKTLRQEGKPLTGFDGYKSAQAVAAKVGGVAVRA